MIPTRTMCENLWDEKGLPDHLKSHLAAVAGLSVKIGAALNEKGYSLSLPLIEAAALLHDLEKGTPSHAAKGAETLEALGFTEPAPIVKSHMRLPDGFQPEISELAVVFLADKLFIGSQAVSVEKRYAEKLLASRGQPALLLKIGRQLKIAHTLKRYMENILGIRDILTLQ